MFSYLNALQDVVDKVIVQRGQRLFLEGKVQLKENLILDYWRLYKVNTNQDEPYLVKIPLIHLALSRDKHLLAGQAMQEVASCTCAYFLEYGLCKHISAVCASLDSEFRVRSTPSIEKKAGELFESTTQLDITDQINRSNLQKQHNEWLTNFEKAILESNWYGKEKFLSSLTTELSLDFNHEHTEFWPSLNHLLKDYGKDFDTERNIASLAAQTLLYNVTVWWDFWSQYVFEWDIRNSRIFWYKLMQWKSDQNVAKEFDRITQTAKQNYSENSKKQIIDYITERMGGDFNSQLILCKAIGYYPWIRDNLHKIDPTTLLTLTNEIPECESQIEIIIAEQLKEWSLIIESGGDGQELIGILRAWSQTIGQTETFEETLNYILANTKHKRKLFNELKKFIR